MNPVARRSLLVLSLTLLAVSLYGMLGGAPQPDAAPATAAQARLLFGPAYLTAVEELLGGARQRIWVAMYTMSYVEDRPNSVEDKIIGVLEERHRKGVDVRVLLDASQEWNAETKRMDGPPNLKNEAAYHRLESAGIPVRYDALERVMHAKAILVDDDQCVVGSTNWTYGALQKNAEISVLLRSHELARELALHFEELWAGGKTGALAPPEQP